MPRDWTKPVLVNGSELEATIAAAHREGFNAHLMVMTDIATYRVVFWKMPVEKHFK